MSGTSSGEQKKNVDVGMHFQEVISLRIKEIEFGGGGLPDLYPLCAAIKELQL